MFSLANLGNGYEVGDGDAQRLSEQYAGIVDAMVQLQCASLRPDDDGEGEND